MKTMGGMNIIYKSRSKKTTVKGVEHILKNLQYKNGQWVDKRYNLRWVGEIKITAGPDRSLRVWTRLEK